MADRDSGSPPPATTNFYSSAVVTAGAALVAGLLLIFGSDLPEVGGATDYSGLAIVAVVLGAVALALVALASYDWQASGTDSWAWLRRFFGPSGVASRLAPPLGWVAAAVAAVVVATVALPEVIRGLQAEAVFNVGLLVFVALAVIGWAPSASRGWPAGLRLSPLTVVGSVVALALVGAYLLFLWVLSTNTGAEADEWARLVEIRATLEALAFAAAGALIGQTVTRTAVSGQLEAKDEQLEQKDATIDAKQEALASALNEITPDDVTVTPDTFRSIDVESIRSAGPASAARVQKAREALIEGLRVDRKP